MDNLLHKFILFIKFDLRLSVNTVSCYQNDLKNYIHFLAESQNIKDINQIQFKDARAYVAFITKEGYKPASVNRNISSIKKFHLFLMDNELTHENPSELLESQKNRRNFPDTLSVDEIESIFNVIDISVLIGLRDLSILTLLYSTGMRVSELINLELSNVFLNEEYVKIMGKGKKERIVPLGLKAKNALISYLNKNQDIGKINNQGYIFLSYRSKQLTRMSIFNIIKKYCLLADIGKTVSPHTFRHRFATHMLEGGADLRIVQELLGHENINTTEIYTHLDRTYLKEVHKLCHPRG